MSEVPPGLRILVVCTANVCRSPVAERLLHRHLLAAGHASVVRSAGTHGGSLGVHEHTLRAASDVDVDLHDHRSRALSASLIVADGADLVITMTREHLRHVAALDPTAWPRSFTLKELARRGLHVPPATGDLGGWVTAVGADRRAADMMTPSPDDDLDDPYGGPYRGHVEMVAEVDGLTRRIAAMFPG